MVGAGIFLSRIAGFVREAVFASFFGATAVADVWRVALRTPNVIQNLLGEGTLSASFIPVYAEMLEQGREEDAGRFAGAALGLLASVAFGIALLGILLAPVFVPFILPQWSNAQHDLTVRVMRILFPMTATLVLSAWSLGILNSHGRFFLSYVAPVAWNLALIATLVAFGSFFAFELESLVVALAWGGLVGGLLQLMAQLPWVAGALGHFRFSISRRVVGVEEAIRNLIPVIAARGVVNLSGWIDMILAGLLATGAMAVLGYAQTLYVLPISLFGMSIAAAELPELSRRRGEADVVVAERVKSALGRVRYLVIPSALAYLAIGDVLVAAVYQRGLFQRSETALVYAVLSAYSLGLIASSSSRVLSSAFYALRDTRTPARVAYARVGVSLAVGLALMFPLDLLDVGILGAGGDGGALLRLGAVGLALGATVGAWVEYSLLRRALRRRLGPHSPRPRTTVALVAAGTGAVATALVAKLVLGSIVPSRAGWIVDSLGPESAAAAWLLALGTAVPFGVVYLALAWALGASSADGNQHVGAG